MKRRSSVGWILLRLSATPIALEKREMLQPAMERRRV
jgi:hypothetical protein